MATLNSGSQMECELHNLALKEAQLFSDRDVAMVSPSIDYLLSANKFSHHIPFYYSDTKLHETQLLHCVWYCPQCDEQLTTILKRHRTKA